MNLRNAQYMRDQDPVDPTCSCYACKNHSRGYLHHLFRVGEGLGMQLLSIHNVATMNRLMRDVRQAIRENRLDQVQKDWVV
jgi:queuine tRNA-ribosyltransferase